MNPILLDTNAYAAMKRGSSEALSVVQRAPFIGITATILGELLGGFALGTREAQNRQELEVFRASPRVALYSVGRAAAEHCGTLRNDACGRNADFPPMTSGSPPALFNIR